MAESKNNIVMYGVSGKLGNLIVFRQKGDKTFVAKAPKPKTSEKTEAQQNHHSRFQQAVVYGKSVVADVNAKAEYENAATNGKSAYNVAIADFFNAPDIHEVDISEYTGELGSRIRVRVTDDFKVTNVRVKIENPDQTIVEEGLAVNETGGPDWFYVAKNVNDAMAGDKITVTASDRPENETVKETSIEG